MYATFDYIIFALRNGTMVNYPITVEDVKRFNMVYDRSPWSIILLLIRKAKLWLGQVI